MHTYKHEYMAGYHTYTPSKGKILSGKKFLNTRIQKFVQVRIGKNHIG